MTTHQIICNEVLRHLLTRWGIDSPAEEGGEGSSYLCLYRAVLGSIKYAVVLHPTKPRELILISEIPRTGRSSVSLLLNHCFR